MTFVYGQGITADVLSQIKPRDAQEGMLLEALESAYRALGDIQIRPATTLDYDASRALSLIEHIVLVWRDNRAGNDGKR